MARGLRFLLLFAALSVTTISAQAAEIVIRNAQLTAIDEAYNLSAEFGLILNGRLEDAVSKGVVLHFLIEFELTRSRWYWFDEQVVRRHKSVQLAYLALPRQYRVSVGNQHQTYNSLGEAMRGMSRVAGWAVIDKGSVKPDEPYQAALSMRLDLSQMPKTFQVSALSSKDWNLTSSWLRWTFLPRDAVVAPTVEPPSVPPALPLPELPLPVPPTSGTPGPGGSGVPSLHAPAGAPGALGVPVATPASEAK